jgi:hypothetical protein
LDHIFKNRKKIKFIIEPPIANQFPHSEFPGYVRQALIKISTKSRPNRMGRIKPNSHKDPFAAIWFNKYTLKNLPARVKTPPSEL